MSLRISGPATLAVSVGLVVIACSGGGGTTASTDGGPGSTGTGTGIGTGTGTGPGSGTGTATGSGSGTGTGGTGTGSGTGASTGSGSGTGGTTFPAGTICNTSGTKLTPPGTLKHVLVLMFENENFGNVNGNANAPYMTSIAADCAYASAYNDNCFTDNLVSLPHYLALTSGSNCNTGLDGTGTGCITDDNDATAHTLTTTPIFTQVSSWKAYIEDMPSACDQSSNGNYACKHNPPPYYTSLSGCSTNDVVLPSVTCTSTLMTKCGSPSNTFTSDLANDTLPEFAWVTPNLQNDMHDGTVQQGDNWLYTYLPLVLQSPAYLRGEMAIFVLWDEQSTSTSGGATPNIFISPYITKGTVVSTAINHFASLRAFETALGISTYLGCASGTKPGGGTCPAGSTEDERALFNF
jgi:hypothetical protein